MKVCKSGRLILKLVSHFLAVSSTWPNFVKEEKMSLVSKVYGIIRTNKNRRTR